MAKSIGPVVIETLKDWTKFFKEYDTAGIYFLSAVYNRTIEDCRPGFDDITILKKENKLRTI